MASHFGPNVTGCYPVYRLCGFMGPLYISLLTYPFSERIPLTTPILVTRITNREKEVFLHKSFIFFYSDCILLRVIQLTITGRFRTPVLRQN